MTAREIKYLKSLGVSMEEIRVATQVSGPAVGPWHEFHMEQEKGDAKTTH